MEEILGVSKKCGQETWTEVRKKKEIRKKRWYLGDENKKKHRAISKSIVPSEGEGLLQKYLFKRTPQSRSESESIRPQEERAYVHHQ